MRIAARRCPPPPAGRRRRPLPPPAARHPPPRSLARAGKLLFIVLFLGHLFACFAFLSTQAQPATTAGMFRGPAVYGCAFPLGCARYPGDLRLGVSGPDAPMCEFREPDLEPSPVDGNPTYYGCGEMDSAGVYVEVSATAIATVTTSPSTSHLHHLSPLPGRQRVPHPQDPPRVPVPVGAVLDDDDDDDDRLRRRHAEIVAGVSHHDLRRAGGRLGLRVHDRQHRTEGAAASSSLPLLTTPLPSSLYSGT